MLAFGLFSIVLLVGLASAKARDDGTDMAHSVGLNGTLVAGD